MTPFAPCLKRFLWGIVTAISLASADLPSRESVTPSLSRDATAIRDRLEELRQAAPVRSADGRIRIGGAALGHADRLVLAHFVEDVRTRAARLLRISFDGPAYTIALWADETDDGTGAVLYSRVEPDPETPIRIRILNPRHLDPPDLARVLCQALLRADALAHGYQDPVEATLGIPRRVRPYPAWFGTGVARLLEVAQRQQDAERIMDRWSRAELPGADRLARAFSPHADADPALSAQLVAWLLDTPERGERMSRLRDDLAQGSPWTSARFATLVAGTPDPARFNTAWDLWLLARRWAVLTPGTTTPELLRRTPEQLLTRPGNPGTPLHAWTPRRPKTPAELIPLRTAPWIPTTANRAIFILQRLANGRDDAYRTMAEDYIAFFVALQRGDSEPRLQRRLARAEAARVALEAKEQPRDDNP